MKPNSLTTLLQECRGAPVRPLDAGDRQTLEGEYQQLLELLNQGVPVYGLNRLTGHRDLQSSASPESLAKSILDTHTIGEAPWYEPTDTRSIGVARLATWRAGGSGVPPALFDHVVRLLDDPGFTPQVPRQNTYSCGDVIPAAHWAQAVLRGTQGTGAFTGQVHIMALINGAFVHAGLALTTLAPLRNAWVLFFENTVAMMPALSNNSFALLPARFPHGPAAEASRVLRSRLSGLPGQQGSQDPVSLRASDDLFDALLRTTADMADRLAEALSSPSANPQFHAGVSSPISQASFLLPSLTLAQGALINALLFTMWAQVGRVTHLLSGKVPSIPLDAATPARPLGLIQHPKRMMALLEEARFLGGRATFASGGATSYGIEDLWTHGVMTTEILKQITDRFMTMCAIEAFVLMELQSAGMLSLLPSVPADIAPLWVRSSTLSAHGIAKQVNQRLDHDTAYPRHGFPIPC